MSSSEGTFNLPFVSNLLNGKLVDRVSSLRQRSTPMKEKAICLDDDPLSLRLVEYLLKGRYEVICCPNIDAAIRAVQMHKSEILLCDYHLSESFTGVQAWRRLSSEHGFNPTHRVLITSYPSPEITQESLEIGFDRVFSKPLRREFQDYCLKLWIPPVTRPAVSY